MACTCTGRDIAEVKLLLATKTVSIPDIQEALSCGIGLVGENKVQELAAKQPLLKQEGASFHFIGHLQTNKVKDVLKYADCIQSVDRLDLAKKLHERLCFENRTMDIMLQVNTSAEATKFGVHPGALADFAKQVAVFDTLKVKGLMTIGLFDAEQARVRNCFRTLRVLKERLQQYNLPGFDMQELSMGMSNDLETAIDEGATIIRVGTAIFGKRIYPDSYYWNEQQ
ncbi:MAG: YggS family pyridoxal phosphate-dependent enzyme [Flavipsychrobacter sp.]|nr:YggS family pyridoxal phosphate-dependent enzyme [Flavipsychrobacter sp.]